MNFCHLLAFLVLTSRLQTSTAQTIYKLDTSYSGDSLFSEFDFYTGTDPTHGFVNYLDQDSATAEGLVYVQNGVAHMGVDSVTVIDASNSIGRSSVRISSQKSWTHALFIADIAHMPGSQCGIWPAFWTLGPDWPNHGEVDIIEGVNSQQSNLMSCHTGDDCTIAGSNELGTLQTNDCFAYGAGNSGCGVLASTTASYGTEFNAKTGGIYAMEWTSSYIRIWFFQRGSIPLDISGGNPDPGSWGLPQANFQGSCDIDSHFSTMQIVFDMTFCGDWASNVWSTDAICSHLSPTCVEYVANTPSAYIDSYWAINSVNVYTLQPNATINGPTIPVPAISIMEPPLQAVSIPSSSAEPSQPAQQQGLPQLAGDFAAGSQASQVPVAEGPDGQITSPSPLDTPAQSNPDLPTDGAGPGAGINKPQVVLQPPNDYLPPITTSVIPMEQIFGQARGGCACGNDSATTTTAEKTYVDLVSCTSSLNPLSYGSMTALATQISQINEINSVTTTGMAPSTTCEEVPSITSDNYLQVSSAAAVEVGARLTAVGAVLGAMGLVGMIL